MVILISHTQQHSVPEMHHCCHTSCHWGRVDLYSSTGQLKCQRLQYLVQPLRQLHLDDAQVTLASLK